MLLASSWVLSRWGRRLLGAAGWRVHLFLVLLDDGTHLRDLFLIIDAQIFCATEKAANLYSQVSQKDDQLQRVYA
jgi:hypothetical protein